MRFLIISLSISILLFQQTQAQFNPNQSGLNENSPFNQEVIKPEDSATDTKDAKNEWLDETISIHYNYLNSQKIHYLDTLLAKFHHFQPSQHWWGKDLGNYGTSTYNSFFDPKMDVGTDLGIRAYDLYYTSLKNMKLYHTNRPYSEFKFTLGSHTEQHASILHTQNVNPLWNFAFNFNNLNTPGSYLLQKLTSNSFNMNNTYQSKDLKYKMTLAFQYFKINQDENGGIVADSFLTLPDFKDKNLIPVNFPDRSGFGSSQRAAINNQFMIINFLLDHHYSWGVKDTLYNQDSTKFKINFTPRFQIKHALNIQSQKRTYSDIQPNADRYEFLATFTPLERDTLFSAQTWNKFDNKFSLNGYLGKELNLVNIEAGLGISIDQFKENFRTGKQSSTTVNNYIFGALKKEALDKGQWQYDAAVQFYFSGRALGDLSIQGKIGKEVNRIGELSIGIQQSIATPGYTWEHFKSNYFDVTHDFSKTSTTKLWGKLYIEPIKVNLQANNYLIANYLYYNEHLLPVQQSEAFSLFQLYAENNIKWRGVSLNNEIIFQQATPNAPVNVPGIMLRHILMAEGYVVKKALLAAIGIEVRYSTPYFIPGYTPFANQFYYQNVIKPNNSIESTVFLNFKIKRFRCFVSVDQLQQFVFKKNNQYVVHHPVQNALFRFGFNWGLLK